MQVDTISNFEWQRQLRYYWDLDQDTCLATMALATYVYGYEYLGACPRLVITPLTVSCRTCCPDISLFDTRQRLVAPALVSMPINLSVIDKLPLVAKLRELL